MFLDLDVPQGETPNLLLVRVKQVVVRDPLHLALQVDGQGTLSGLQVLAHLIELRAKGLHLNSSILSSLTNTSQSLLKGRMRLPSSMTWSLTCTWRTRLGGAGGGFLLRGQPCRCSV